MTDFVTVQRTDTFDTWRAQTNVLGTNVGAMSGLSGAFSGHNSNLVTAMNYLQTSAGVSAGGIEQQTASSSQTVFTLTTLSYSVGTGSLKVYIDGIRQFPGTYTETNSTTVTFSAGLSAASVAAFEVAGLQPMEFNANALSGATLASSVVTSSLTTVGTIGTGVWQGSVVAGQYGGTGVANTGKTITLGGNLTTSGAFATTLTITAATNVTLPTSGTLATTGQQFYIGTTAIAINQGSGTVTLPNAALTNSSVTIGSTAVSLGSTVTAFSGLTTLRMSGQLTSTLATGTAPFVVASTTNVANLNASSLKGATFASPGAIGSGTPGTGRFTTLTATATAAASGTFTTLTATGTSTIEGYTTRIISTATTATAGTTYVAKASLAFTLPASPAAGDVVGFVNASATTTCTINPGSNYIMGVSGTMTVDSLNANFNLQYSGNSTAPGWVFI